MAQMPKPPLAHVDQPQEHRPDLPMEEKVLEELEKLKLFVHGQFERQNAFITTLTRLAAGAPDEKKVKKVEEDAKVLDERPLGVELSPELERALKLGTASSDQPSLELRSSGMSVTSTSDSLNSSDTFVHDFLNKFQQKAKTAGDRLKQIRRTSMLTETEDEKSLRAIAKKIVGSHFFAYTVTTIITFNLVILGIEVDVSVDRGQNEIPQWFGICNGIVVILFTFELALSLFAQGCSTFFCGREKWWNWFDLMIICLSIMEAMIDFWVGVTASSQGVSPQHLRFVRTVRLARALRGVRVMRLLRYVSALRTLVLSIMSSMASLLWTLVLLMLLFYSFGVLFTQMVSDECRWRTVLSTDDMNAVPSCPDDFVQYWKTIPESMLTLFMAITGGVDWELALMPLRDISIFAVGGLIVYVTITFFAIVNVITGVFVTTAMETTAADKDLTVMKQMQKHNAQVEDLKSLFREICGSGRFAEVSLDEFQRAMSSKKFIAFLQSMGIGTEDVAVLFKLLDADASGLVDLEEFVTGCLNLHGSAKSSQLARMSYENKLTRREIKHIRESFIDLHVMTRMIYENWSI